MECFLTTACCDAMGRPDDCFELTTLRRFRDEFMMASPEGADEVRLYYAVAPQIAHALQHEQPRSESIDIYYRYVVPCVFFAWAGFNVHARRLYREMVLELHAKFGAPSIA